MRTGNENHGASASTRLSQSSCCSATRRRAATSALPLRDEQLDRHREPVDVAHRVSTTEDVDLLVDVVTNSLDPLLQRLGVGVELLALVAVELQSKLLDVLGLLEFVEAPLDARLKISERAPQPLLLRFALGVHASAALFTHLLGAYPQGFLQRGLQSLPLIDIPVANVVGWRVSGGGSDCCAGLADVESAVTTTDPDRSGFDDFVEGRAVGTVHHDPGMGDGNGLVDVGVANGDSVDLAVDRSAPDLGPQRSKAPGDERVTHMEVGDVLVTVGDLGIKRDRESEILDLVVEADQGLAPCAAQVVDLQDRHRHPRPVRAPLPAGCG